MLLASMVRAVSSKKQTRIPLGHTRIKKRSVYYSISSGSAFVLLASMVRAVSSKKQTRIHPRAKAAQEKSLLLLDIIWLRVSAFVEDGEGGIF